MSHDRGTTTDPCSRGRLVPVLMYHSVSAVASREFRPFAVDPRAFEQHMEFLADAGYRPITIGQYLAGTPAADPERSGREVVLTFDDAFADFHSDVLPVLQRFGFPATLYVPTDYVGSTSRWLAVECEADRRIMSWNGLAEVASSGIEIGSHTRSHCQLDLVPSDQVRSEVVDSKHELENRLQREISTFAYPFGYYNADVRAAVERAGYTSACAVRNLVDEGRDHYVINRFTVRYGMTAEDLRGVMLAQPSRISAVRSSARALASRVLRRSGVRRRGVIADEQGVA